METRSKCPSFVRPVCLNSGMVKYITSVVLHHGRKRERSSERLAQCDRCINNLHHCNERRITLDEAHEMRNRKSQMSQSLHATQLKSIRTRNFSGVLLSMCSPC